MPIALQFNDECSEASTHGGFRIDSGDLKAHAAGHWLYIVPNHVSERRVLAGRFMRVCSR